MTERKATEPQRRGPKARVTREAIAEAAIAVGFDRVTLQLVAEHLGMDHSSLYRHVSGREDILSAGADLAISRLPWRADTTDWRVYVQTAGEAVWHLYRGHPGLADVMRGLAQTPPAGMRAFAETVRQLSKWGFAVDDAAVIVDSVMDMTSDAASSWERICRKADKGTETIGQGLLRSWRDVAAAEIEMAEEIEAMSRQMVGSPDAWWRRKLNLILDGAAHLRRA